MDEKRTQNRKKEENYFQNKAIKTVLKKEINLLGDEITQMASEELESCRRQILSEDYRDFIGNPIRTPLFDELVNERPCSQDAGLGYECFYFPKEAVEPITLERYSYNSIPNCFAPVSLATLNQTGILPVQNYPTLQLSGKGVLIGFLDSGIDYTNSVFRNLDGTTRIAAIWDQTVQSGIPPKTFAYGTEYRAVEINTALQNENPVLIVPTVDESGHGTYIASLAAGGANAAEEFLGAAPEASIAVVKLKQAKQYLREYYCIPEQAVCYQETDLILGLRYLNDLAEELNLPLVICISVGSNMGGHVGTLPLPSLIGNYSLMPNRIAVIGTGNEADKRHHYFNRIQNVDDTKTVEVRVGEGVSGFTTELWVMVPNLLSIAIISPSGEDTSRIPLRVGTSTKLDFLFEKTKVTVEYRLSVEKTNSELVFFRFQAPAAGIWKIVVEPIRLVDGAFHLWLPITEFMAGEVYFLEADPYYTLTNPSNAPSPIIVSYYNGTTGGIAQESGRGYTRTDFTNPSITAPGINVKGALPGGRFAARSGSCVAAAVTAGAVALMLEWELYQQDVPGIDVFQIKSLLILGAVRPETMEYPNREWGYGQLNLYNTFEAMRQR